MVIEETDDREPFSLTGKGETGQPKEVPLEERCKHHKHLNILIPDECFVEKYRSASQDIASQGILSLQHIRAEKCVELNIGLQVLKCIFDSIPEKGLRPVFGSQNLGLGFWPAALASSSLFTGRVHLSTLSRIMLLTPRHLLSLICYFCMACTCMSGIRFLLLFVLFGGLVSSSGAGPLITTNQQLPDDCLAWFTVDGADCPEKAKWDPRSYDNGWGWLNHTCCSGFPATVLHCQRQDTSNFPACLPEQEVGIGDSGQLEKDDKGNPLFEIIPCDPKTTYESDVRVSSNVTFPYCLRRKSMCRGVGEKPLCSGGTAADNFCTCSTGYKPIREGCHFFNDQDECWCKSVTCAAGEVPVSAAVPTSLCADLLRDGFVPQSGCRKISTSTVPPAATGQNPSSDVSMPNKSDNTSHAVFHSIENITNESAIPPQTGEGNVWDIIYRVARWFVISLMIAFLGFLGGCVYIANMEDGEQGTLPFCEGRLFLNQCQRSVG